MIHATPKTYGDLHPGAGDLHCLECSRNLGTDTERPICGFRCARAYARGNRMDLEDFRAFRRNPAAWSPRY